MDESNFYSLDKLVDFGMTLAVATQMAATMNESMNQMKVPGVNNIMTGANGYGTSVSSDPIFYVAIDDKAEGPFSSSEVSRLLNEKAITKETYVWMPGMKTWDLAGNVESILRIVAMTPPPIPQG